MKKYYSLLLALVVVLVVQMSSSSAIGGDLILAAVDPVNVEDVALFGDTEIQVEALGYYLTSGDVESSGGGVGLGMFFTRNIGIRAQGIWGAADSGSLRAYTGDLVFRYPVEAYGVAPYAFVGGGAGEVVSDNGTVGLGRAGGGVEWRITPGLGLFGEAAYTWTESDGDDFPLALFGIRLNF